MGNRMSTLQIKRRYCAGLILVFAMISVTPAFAFEIFTDKLAYQTGDEIVLAGTIRTVDPDLQATILFFDPNGIFFILDQFDINPDGKFSKTYKSMGIAWGLDGTYRITLTYGDKTAETIFEFTTVKNKDDKNEDKIKTDKEDKADAKQTNPEKPDKTSADKDREPSRTDTEKESQTEPPPESDKPVPDKAEPKKTKTHIPGFPEPNKSPQYYIDRYNDESDYRDWFDSAFPGQSVESIVGYDTAGVSGFLEPDRAPQYYIDRYNDESDYRDWFDSAFPDITIHEAVGFPTPLPIPDWVRQSAQQWSEDGAGGDFVAGIGFIIQNNILLGDASDPGLLQDGAIPSWVGHNARWWAQGEISDGEYVAVLRHLVDEGIIRV